MVNRQNKVMIVSAIAIGISIQIIHNEYFYENAAEIRVFEEQLINELRKQQNTVEKQPETINSLQRIPVGDLDNVG
ncbi:MAG: hypothetical protein HON94_11275 [Methylococcales bacterium]|jgi:hypothetical protein|nr:hypothetical protein [Methylococcales bacterium]MBT7409114.1 hypothetical protein [Methylococcales bacterium]